MEMESPPDMKTDLSKDRPHAKSIEAGSEHGPDMADPEGDDRDQRLDPEGLKAGPPLDRGWSWVVLAAACFELFIFGGMMKSTGIFFVEYQKRFATTASATSVVGSLQNFVTSVSTLVVMTIVMKKISGRSAVMLGSVTSAVGFLISAFATDIQVLYFSYGVFGGIGMSLFFFPLIHTMSMYFKKHRAFANSIMMSGTCIGSLAFAPAITAMFDTYGYTGAMIMVAGLYLNIVISGSLLRPAEFYTKRSKQSVHSIGKCDRIDTDKIGKEMQVSNSEASREPLLVSGNSNCSPAEEAEVVPPTQRSPSLEITDHQTSSENKNTNSLIGVHGSSDVANGEVFHREINSKDSSGLVPRCCVPSKCVVPSKFLAAVCGRDSVIRNPVFLVYLLMACVIFPGFILVTVYIAPYANDLGIASTNIGLLYTISGATDFITRLSAGFVVGKKWVRHTTVLASAGILIGTAAHLLRFFPNFSAMVVFAVLMGLSCGVYLTLFGTIVADFVGPEQYKDALGVTGLVHGVSNAIAMPLTGLLRDISGSYVVPFHFIGVLVYAGAGLALVLPVVHNWHEKKQEHRKDAS